MTVQDYVFILMALGFAASFNIVLAGIREGKESGFVVIVAVLFFILAILQILQKSGVF